MPGPHALIVIGTSAGGMPALTELVSQLPGTLPAAVMVVQHLAPDSSGEFLVGRLNRHTDLCCHLATSNMLIEPGHLYLAPPNHHLLVHEGKLLTTKGPRENSFRPSADALFRSAAVTYSNRVIGVVLTGMLHDGTAGLEYVKRCGGRAVVQDPLEAEFPSMPESALRNVAVDYVISLAQMGILLEQLAQLPPGLKPAPVPDDLKLEAAIAERVVGDTNAVQKLGRQVPLTCPDCGGSLWEMKRGKVLRYRCHTGHSFTADSLLESTKDSLEETLWVALRMMEERKNLLTNMASRGEGSWSHQQEERIDEIKLHINRLREFLLSGIGSNGAAAAESDSAREIA